MDALAYVERAREWSGYLEDAASARAGLPIERVRPTVARKLRTPPGTLENLRSGRLKRVAVDLYERLRSAVVAELEAEMRRLQHELDLTRQAGMDPRSIDVGQVVAHLEAVRSALGR